MLAEASPEPGVCCDIYTTGTKWYKGSMSHVPELNCLRGGFNLSEEFKNYILEYPNIVRDNNLPSMLANHE
jgi:hypothetical protein